MQGIPGYYKNITHLCIPSTTQHERSKPARARGDDYQESAHHEASLRPTRSFSRADRNTNIRRKGFLESFLKRAHTEARRAF